MYTSTELHSRPEFAPQQEVSIDALIWNGEFETAYENLEREIASLIEQGASRDTYHRMRLKLASLPLYDLALNGASPEKIDRALDVYGELAELLAEELLTLESLHSRYRSRVGKEQRKSIGRISEIAGLCLLARDLHHEDPTLVLLPSNQEDDVYGGSRATDYYLMSVKGKGTALYPTQLKTKLTDDDRANYESPINPIGLDELDPEHYGRQYDERSISSAMLRELSGQSLPEDQRQLELATFAFYSRIHVSSNSALVNHPTKKGWLTL